MKKSTFGRVLATILFPVILGGVLSCKDNEIMPKLENNETKTEGNGVSKQNWVDINSSDLSIQLELNSNSTKHLEVGISTGNGTSKNTMLDYSGLKEGAMTRLALAVCYYDDASKAMKPVAYGIVGADVKSGNRLHYAGDLTKMNTVNFNEWSNEAKVKDTNRKWYLVGITLDKETSDDLENNGVEYDGKTVYKSKVAMEDLPGEYLNGVYALDEKILLRKATEVKAGGNINIPFYMPYTAIDAQWSQKDGKTTVVFKTPIAATFKPVGQLANIRFKNYMIKNARFMPNKDIFIIYRTKAFASKGTFNILGDGGMPNGDIPVKTNTMMDICFQVNTGDSPQVINSNQTSNADDDFLAWIVPTGIEDNYSCVIKSANQVNYGTRIKYTDMNFIELQGQEKTNEFTPNGASMPCMYTSKSKLTVDNIKKNNIFVAAINSDVIISEVYHCASTEPDSINYRNQSLFEFYNPTVNKIDLSDYGVVRARESTSNANSGNTATYPLYTYSEGKGLENALMYSLKDEYEWYPAYRVGNGATPETDALLPKEGTKTVSFGEDKLLWGKTFNGGMNYYDYGYKNSGNKWYGFDPGKTVVLTTAQVTFAGKSNASPYAKSYSFANYQSGAPREYSGFTESIENISKTCQSIQTCILTLGGNGINYGNGTRYPVWDEALNPTSEKSSTMQHGTYDGYALLKRITYKERDTSAPNNERRYKEVTRYVVVDVFGPSADKPKMVYMNLLYDSSTASGVWNTFKRDIESALNATSANDRDNKYDRYWATRKDGSDFPSIYFNPAEWDFAVPLTVKTGNPTCHENYKNGTPTMGYRYNGQNGFRSYKP